MSYISKKATREDQKELLETSLKNLEAAMALSRTTNEFAIDGSADNALEYLQKVVDNHHL